MKKTLLLTVFCFLSAWLMAQVPQKLTYQAVIRNSSNALVANKPVGMKISILQGSTAGPAVYEETHTPTTNTNGLASMEIGMGSVLSGSLNKIDWQKGPYFIKTESDPNGDKNYSITSVSQLLTVPYAFYAERATRSDTALVALATQQNQSSLSFPSGKSITCTLTTQWQTLDFGPIIGKGKAYVTFRITNYNASGGSASLIPNGDKTNYQAASYPGTFNSNAYETGLASSFTDENGMIEIRTFGSFTPVLVIEPVIVLRP